MDDCWKPLAFELGQRNYGDFISHEEASSLTGVPLKTDRYYQKVRLALDRQQQLKRHWQLVRGKGYQLLFPHEIHRLAAEHVGKAASSSARSTGVLQSRDGSRIHDLVDRTYESASDALIGVVDLLELIEAELQDIGAPRRFDALNKIAIQACRKWAKLVDPPPRPASAETAPTRVSLDEKADWAKESSLEKLRKRKDAIASDTLKAKQRARRNDRPQLSRDWKEIRCNAILARARGKKHPVGDPCDALLMKVYGAWSRTVEDNDGIPVDVVCRHCRQRHQIVLGVETRINVVDLDSLT